MGIWVEKHGIGVDRRVPKYLAVLNLKLGALLTPEL